MKPTIETEKYTLYLGDCLDVMREMEAGCVDAVITDPPYKKEFNYIYGNMAEGVQHILKQGKLMITLTGHHSFDQILGEMTKYLDFYWIGGMPNKLGSIARYHPRQMMMGWKPCVWLSNGKPLTHKYTFDFMQSKRIERVNHEWEQSIGWFNYYIEKLTNPNDLILDPFMGSGTTGVACMQLGRKFIGVEIDEKYFEIARKRIEVAAAQMVMQI